MINPAVDRVRHTCVITITLVHWVMQFAKIRRKETKLLPTTYIATELSSRRNIIPISKTVGEQSSNKFLRLFSYFPIPTVIFRYTDPNDGKLLDRKTDVLLFSSWNWWSLYWYKIRQLNSLQYVMTFQIEQKSFLILYLHNHNKLCSRPE